MSNAYDFDDDLSPAEKAYFESGGQNTDGLVNENSGTGAAAADDPAARSAPDPKPDAAPAGKPAGAADPGKTPAAQAQPGKQQPAAKQAAAGDDDEDDPPPSGQVPYQKYQRDLRKAKERAKQTEAQLAEFRDKFARGDERLRLLSEAMQPAAGQQQQEADPDPEPDPNVDLFAHNQWMRRQLGRMGEALSATHQQTVETREDAALRDNYTRDAMSFAREMPDFVAAYNHLLGARAAMLSEQGHDEQSIRRILHQEEKGLVQRAFQTNKRPAAMIYAMAKQMGWSPQAAPQPQPGVNGNGNGGAQAQPVGNGNGGQQPSVVAEIERIQRGQAAAKSLSDGGGNPQELSVEALANMSEQDFNALYAKSAGKIDAMLGKRAH